MFKLAIIFISIVWASLLLISWGGATPAPESTHQTIVAADQH